MFAGEKRDGTTKCGTGQKKRAMQLAIKSLKKKAIIEKKEPGTLKESLSGSSTCNVFT
jgi:hypothetical protein